MPYTVEIDPKTSAVIFTFTSLQPLRVSALVRDLRNIDEYTASLVEQTPGTVYRIYDFHQAELTYIQTVMLFAEGNRYRPGSLKDSRIQNLAILCGETPQYFGVVNHQHYPQCKLPYFLSFGDGLSYINMQQQSKSRSHFSSILI